MAETQLVDVFVEMADTLVDDFDVTEFLHVLTERCVQLLGISAAGLLLTDGQDTLQLVAASSERTRLLELFQLQTDQGPCVDCFRTGQPVSVADLPAAGRWPRFTAAAAEVGFATPTPAHWTKASYASDRPWPTLPPSDCCSNAPSTAATS